MLAAAILVPAMALGNLEHLKDLALPGSQGITDAGLVHLKSLRELWLGGPGVTDEGLRHLARLKNLRHLSFSESHVTSRGVERLRMVLPGTYIACSSSADEALNRILNAIDDLVD